MEHDGLVAVEKTGKLRRTLRDFRLRVVRLVVLTRLVPLLRLAVAAPSELLPDLVGDALAAVAVLYRLDIVLARTSHGAHLDLSIRHVRIRSLDFRHASPSFAFDVHFADDDTAAQPF